MRTGLNKRKSRIESANIVEAWQKIFTSAENHAKKLGLKKKDVPEAIAKFRLKKKFKLTS